MWRLYRFLAAIFLALSLSFFVSCGNSECRDNDGDEYGDNCEEGIDCDDDNPTIYEGALEICDGQDNQCPGDVGYGQIDENGCP